HSLTATEAAFFHAGLPFQQEWRPNRYLARSPSDPRQYVPAPLRRDLIGWAGTTNPKTFKLWWAYVFDNAAPASSFAQAETKRARWELVVRANNVVSAGSHLAAASRAMAALRRQ